MKTAYIIGPYRAETISEIRRNIEEARNLAEEIHRMGIMAFCPHANSGMMDGAASDEHFLEGCKELIRRDCFDIAVTLPAWEWSKGSVDEVLLCERRGIQVIHYRNDVDQLYRRIFEALTIH